MNKRDVFGLARTVKGSYILVPYLSERQAITVGKLRTIDFFPGYYAYIGSALGGLRARLLRHIRQEKRMHWHIDFLLREASLDDIIVIESNEKIECGISSLVKEKYPVIEGFGSSDCQCGGHLYYCNSENASEIVSLLDSSGINNR